MGKKKRDEAFAMRKDAQVTSQQDPVVHKKKARARITASHNQPPQTPNPATPPETLRTTACVAPRTTLSALRDRFDFFFFVVVLLRGGRR